MPSRIVLTRLHPPTSYVDVTQNFYFFAQYEGSRSRNACVPFKKVSKNLGNSCTNFYQKQLRTMVANNILHTGKLH